MGSNNEFKDGNQKKHVGTTEFLMTLIKMIIFLYRSRYTVFLINKLENGFAGNI